MVLGIMPALLSGTKEREKDPVTPDKPFLTTVQNNIKTHPNNTEIKVQPKTCIFPIWKQRRAQPRHMNFYQSQPSGFRMISPAQYCVSLLKFVLVNTLTFK